MSPYRLMAMIDKTGLRTYQIVQTVPGEARIITRDDDKPINLAKIQSQLFEILGEKFVSQIDTSGEFVLADSGKRNPVVGCSAPPFNRSIE